MADVIATIWDFDKTLIPNYMQEPIFKHYKFDGAQFWAENRKEIQALRDQGLDVNEDSFYLNRFLEFSKKGGMFEGLNNDLLVRFGKEIEFYEGAVDLFTAVNKLNDEPQYRDAGITFENYIVSTGLKRMIIGSDIFPHVKHVWGAELVDVEENGLRHLGKIAYSLDNTSKTKAIFEINKGVGVVEGASIDVNSKIPESERRVRFRNMVYVADGPSDVPAFSLINEKGGANLGCIPEGQQ
ncbi:HAD family hydrolase [uncultured Parasutterella sp.]|uniref:HAD family hydrolase n=1 Tax=uncultured Parasutterella sp. TaxID=1263098 RepID=UPI0034A2F22A